MYEVRTISWEDHGGRGARAPFGWLFRKRVRSRLRKFFGCDPRTLPVHTRRFATYDLPNLQRAIERLVQEGGGTLETVGYRLPFYEFVENMRPQLGSLASGRARLAAVRWREVDVGEERPMSCIEHGIFLLSFPNGKAAVRISIDPEDRVLLLEAMAGRGGDGAQLVEDIRRCSFRNNVYRGKIISLDGSCGGARISFHAPPNVTREDIVLPEDLMALIERNTVGFYRHAATLRKAGRSVKRGLLFHGVPGTGKTLTAKWLARGMEGLTVILMSGEQLGLIREGCSLARFLAPALVIMEDVDLIAAERDLYAHASTQMTLHELLNEMDGLADDAEVIFLLTTNRPDVIEPAISMRPGRVDQAIEFPLPDADCRRRLFELYGRGLTLELSDLDRLVSRTEGASPAFLQEMMRKAALLAAEEAEPEAESLVVRDRHCEESLREMLFAGGQLTQQLLGFSASAREQAPLGS